MKRMVKEVLGLDFIFVSKRIKPFLETEMQFM
jgi:hypothetical protein